MAGRKVFEPGDVLSANDVNSFLMDQSVMVFASAADRAAQITEPIDGMLTYRTDSKLLQSYNGTAWVGVVPASGNVPAASVVGELTNATIAGGGITGTINVAQLPTRSLIQNTFTSNNVAQKTFTVEDVGFLYIMNNSSTNGTMTFASNTDFPIGGRVDILNSASTGNVTIRSTAGATLFGAGTAGTQYLLSNFDACSVVCVATDSYRIIGNVTVV